MSERKDLVTAQADQTAALLARAKAKFPKSGHLMAAFLDEYERVENQTLAGKTVGIGHDAVAAWKKNPDFMALFTATHIRAARKNNDNLKASMLQRAINGTPKLLTYQGRVVRDEQGQPIVTERMFETQLTMFMAKNRMPDEFRDKFEHEISGQLVITLASEFIAIVRRHATPEVATSIQKELETLSAKLGSS